MIPRRADEQIAQLFYRIAELERRARNRKRTGIIDQVGTGDNTGKYRVKLSGQNGTPYLTGWLKARSLAAGSVKIDVLRSKGEQVDVISENGDLTDAVIDLSTYSDIHPRENADTPFHIKIGDTVIAVGGDGVTITGNVRIKGDLDVDGGAVRNDGTAIDKTHKHGGVMPGGALTGTPSS